MNYTHGHILRYIEGTLPPDDQLALSSALRNDVALSERVDRVRSMRASMRASATREFALGFADRVLLRMRGGESKEDAMYRGLGWVFRRAAIASLIAAIAFGALNFTSYQDGDVSTTVLESIFGQPAVSLGDALAVEPV